MNTERKEPQQPWPGSPRKSQFSGALRTKGKNQGTDKARLGGTLELGPFQSPELEEVQDVYSGTLQAVIYHQPQKSILATRSKTIIIHIMRVGRRDSSPNLNAQVMEHAD